MKKTLKITPAALIAVCALTGCNSYSSKLAEFVGKLDANNLTKDAIKGIYETSILESNDANVTKASYAVADYVPYSALQDGQDESVYETYVHDLNQTETFTKYDNNVVVTTTEYSCYNYDKDMIEDNDGISLTEVAFIGTGYIYKDGSDTRYTYTQDKSAENVYSFTYAKKIDAEDEKKFFNGGGLGSTLKNSVEAVEENYEYYAGQASSYDWLTASDEFEAKKEDKKLTVNYLGSLKWDVFSMERAWGCDADTGEKEYDYWDGYYFQQEIVFSYSYIINDGFIEAARIIQSAYVMTVYKDKNWKEGDPTPAEELSKDEIAALDLEVASTVYLYDGTKYNEYPNPYNGDNIYTGAAYTIEQYSAVGGSQGTFDTTKIPDKSKYRDEIEADDTGAYLSVQDLVNCDAA